MTVRLHSVAAAVVLAAAIAGGACGGGGKTSPTTPTPAPTPPAGPSTPAGVSIVLGRPTDTSIAGIVKTTTDLHVYFEYGTAAGSYSGQTASMLISSATPTLVAVSGLKADTDYYYRARYRTPSESTYSADVEHSFHTKRLSGRTFTFAIQADPHMDDNSSAAVFNRTLQNELADRPDFLVDLGDTSMVEKCSISATSNCTGPSPATQDTVNARYALIRSLFDSVCHSMPLFMVLGNHDGETGWVGNPSSSQLDTWAVAARKTYFPNPEPDRFYTGSSEQVPGIGYRQNYYAFEWGDALFVMLDPFTYTPRKPGQDGWGWTLGATQYQWLANTLASSRARFKFVFSHHLLGGNGSETRGGAAFAKFFEWGGRNLDGSWGFAQQRPGWPAPVHELLVANKVTAWFHGHDHLYAQEQLDGVIYQEVPQPSLARYDTPDPGSGYGYVGTVGTNIFPSSGHLRVTVAPAEVKVDYVRSVPAADETTTRKNGTIVASYTVR